MSLIRDSGRLERLANKLSKNSDADSSGLAALEQAANYVVKFNMAGLYRIESKLFVKWLRDHLCDATVVGPFSEGNAVGISKAFGETIGKIDEYRLQSEKMGNELVSFSRISIISVVLSCIEIFFTFGWLSDFSTNLFFYNKTCSVCLGFQYDLAKSASDASAAPHQRQTLLRDIARLSTQLSERLHVLRNLQETLIVPSVARVVPPGEQKSFNNKVLMQLGLLESRVHLVGMHDAVWDSGMESEKKKFESEIPYVARMMIERWRKSLYIPKAGALDYEF